MYDKEDCRNWGKKKKKSFFLHCDLKDLSTTKNNWLEVQVYKLSLVYICGCLVWARKWRIVGTVVMQLGNSSLTHLSEHSQSRYEPKQQISPCSSTGCFYALLLQRLRGITFRLYCLQTEEKHWTICVHGGRSWVQMWGSSLFCYYSPTTWVSLLKYIWSTQALAI